MSKLYITTTQNVPLFFTPASIGERFLAYFLDGVFKFCYVIVVYLLFFYSNDIFERIKEKDWVFISILFLFSLPVVFYTVVQETFMEGQTFGKKIAKIKVVKIDGYQADFFDYLTRWFFRLVDIDLSYLPGLISMLTTKYTQRIGDIAAGTAVITEKSRYNISHTILMDIDEDYKPYFSRNQALLFSDNDMRIIKENANLAIGRNDTELLFRLTARIQEVMEMKNPFDSHRELIRVLLKDYNFYTGK